MKQNDRINRISLELSKLNNLIQYTKNQSAIALQLLNNCNSESSSQNQILCAQIDSQHSLSKYFNQGDSKELINMTIKNDNGDQFYENKSLQMKASNFMDNQHQKNSNSQFQIHQSNLSSSQFKQSIIEISEIKPIDTTIKKAKLLKSNLNKNKKNLFEKQRILSNNNNSEKIGRIKSQNKFLTNASNFKRGINIIKEQMSLKKDKQKKGPSNMAQNITQIHHKNYLSNKIQTLNSKRNIKYDSTTKGDKQKSSKNRFHLNLEKQVTMKITDLKIKKNLCQIQTSYLSASVKISKQQILKIQDTTNKYSDQTLLKYFILKSIIKFISQYNDQTWTNSQSIEIDNQKVSDTLKRPQKFIKIINKLPDILRRRNIVSQYICKEFIQQKSFIQQKVSNLGIKSFIKQPLYVYLCQLHLYIQFLLNNNMIHETKRNKIFNPTSQQFFSQRSAKQMKLTVANTKQQKFRQSKKKQFSERKKTNTTTLKRVNTSKALKKGTASVKPKKS